MRIWIKYFFFRTTKLFILFFCCISILFILVDISAHGQKVFHGMLNEALFYFIFQITNHLDLFVNLSFSLATLKVLIEANTHFELVALQSAGISKKKIIYPFFLLSLLCTCFLLLNAEIFCPFIQKKLTQSFKKSLLKKEQKLFQIHLKGPSHLVFSAYDKKEKKLSDVYWVVSPKSIWHMKTLELSTPPKALFVDYFKEKDGKMNKVYSSDQKYFPKLQMSDTHFSLFFKPLLHRKLSALLLEKNFFSNPDQAILLTHFHHKWMMSLLPMVILLLLFPFLCNFLRNFFYICVISFFLLFFFFMAAKSLVFLGENGVVSPFFAAWSLFILFGNIGSFFYLKKI